MKDLSGIPRTAMDVFNMLPEGTRCEMIDNALYMLPTPTTQHQLLLSKLLSKINLFSNEYNLGTTLVGLCDVYLNDEENVVIPDLLFIKTEHEYIIEKKGIIGAPDLIIEILSTNKLHDQQRKLELYERNAVPEYIIIDPETRQVWHYVLQDEKYTLKAGSISGKLVLSQLNFEIVF